MQLLPSLLSDLKAVCAACPDLRKGRGGNNCARRFRSFGLRDVFYAERVVSGLSAHYGKRPSAAPIVRRYSASAGFPPTITSAIFSTRTPRSCSPVSNAWRRCYASRRCRRPSAGWTEEPWRLGRNGVLLLTKARLSALS